MDMALKNLSNGAIALLLGVVTAAVAAVGIVMTIATTQMFGLTGRIDTLYTDSAGVKADVAKTAAATEYMKQDMAEMKTTLREMSTTLQSIDKRLAQADIKGGVPASFVLVKDPSMLAKFLWSQKIQGPILVNSPARTQPSCSKT